MPANFNNTRPLLITNGIYRPWLPAKALSMTYISIICEKIYCINSCMVISNLLISLVPYFYNRPFYWQVSAVEARFNRLHPRKYALSGAKKPKSWKSARHKLVKTKAQEPIIRKKELGVMKKIKDLENVMPTFPPSTSKSSMDIFIF